MKWATATALAIILAVAAMVASFAFALTIDRGPSYSYVETPSQLLAVTSEDVVSPLAVAGSSIVTSYDATIAIASETVTDNDILTTGGLLLLAAIGAIYLIENDTGHLRHLRRIGTTMARKLSRSVTFLRSHGGAAYAMSIAFLAVVVIGALVQTTGTSLA